MKIRDLPDWVSLWAYDQILCRSIDGTFRPALKENRKISVAIAHYQRAESVHLPLKNILGDERIEDIVIYDDGSEEREYEQLRRSVEKIEKVRLFRRDVNAGALRTKWEAVEQCASDWVLLLDADNTAFRSYLDSLFAVPCWNSNSIYCPSFAWPFFDFRVLANRELDFEMVRAHVVDGLLRRVYLLNDGNYFLPRQNFLEVTKPALDLPRSAADVLEVNYAWLSAGKTLNVLGRDAIYCHRVSSRSYWNEHSAASRKRLLEILSQIERGEYFAQGSPPRD